MPTVLPEVFPSSIDVTQIREKYNKKKFCLILVFIVLNIDIFEVMEKCIWLNWPGI
jgi:hypothetical protein